MAQFYDYIPEGEQYQHMRDAMAGWTPDGRFLDYIPEEGPPPPPPEPAKIDPNLKAAVEQAKIKDGVAEGYCPSGCGYGGPEKSERQLRGHMRFCRKLQEMEQQPPPPIQETRNPIDEACKAVANLFDEEDGESDTPDPSIYRVKE